MENGQTVSVVLNGHTYTSTVTSNAWSVSAPAADLAHAQLPDANYTVTANVSDLAGNPATQATHGLTVDETKPTVSSEAITSATGIQNSTLNAGDVVSVTVTLSEAVTVTGTPQLALNIGGTTVQANYASGSGSSALVFTYTILAGQTDTNGISINANALSLNGGTITDAAGNAATLTAAAVTDNASFKVDTTAPDLTYTKLTGNKMTGTYSDTDSGIASVEVKDTTPGHTFDDILTVANGGLSGGNWSDTNSAVQNNNSLTIIATDLAGNTKTLNTSAPAGISAEAINIGLAQPLFGANVSVSLSGLPNGWSVNGGIHNADGSWSTTTSDPGSLTVTTAADFVGALVLNVTETWTNADGSTGTRNRRRQRRSLCARLADLRAVGRRQPDRLKRPRPVRVLAADRA